MDAEVGKLVAGVFGVESATADAALDEPASANREKIAPQNGQTRSILSRGSVHWGHVRDSATVSRSDCPALRRSG